MRREQIASAVSLLLMAVTSSACGACQGTSSPAPDPTGIDASGAQTDGHTHRDAAAPNDAATAGTDAGGERPEWPAGAWLGPPELLHDLGFNHRGVGLRWLVADDEHLYFVRNSHALDRVAKRPGAPIERVLDTATASNAFQGHVMEEQYLYFTAGNRIRRLDKAQLEVTDFPLDQAYGVLVIVSDEHSLYLANPGCTMMMTMDKATGALRDHWEDDQPYRRGGAFWLVRQGDTLYCSGGAGGALYARSVHGGPAEIIHTLPADHPEGFWPQFGPMLDVEGQLLALRSYSSERPNRYWLSRVEMSETGITVEDISDPIPSWMPSPIYDAARRRIYAHSVNFFQLYDIASARWELLDVEPYLEGLWPHSTYLTQDDDYVYWHTREPQVRIYRQRKL